MGFFLAWRHIFLLIFMFDSFEWILEIMSFILFCYFRCCLGFFFNIPLWRVGTWLSSFRSVWLSWDLLFKSFDCDIPWCIWFSSFFFCLGSLELLECVDWSLILNWEKFLLLISSLFFKKYDPKPVLVGSRPIWTSF